MNEENTTVMTESGHVINTTLERLVNSWDSLALLLNFNHADSKTIRRLIKIGHHVKGEIDTFNQAKKMIIENYKGVLNEQTGRYAFPTPEDQKAVNKELSDLLKVAVQIPGRQFTYYELRTVKDSFSNDDVDAMPSGFTAALAMDLSWLIKD